MTFPKQNIARSGNSNHDELLSQFTSSRCPHKLVRNVEVLGARHGHIHVGGFGGTAGYEFRVVVHNVADRAPSDSSGLCALVTAQVHRCLFIDI